MSNSVSIRVPARLHLGFLDLSGNGGRRFGSVGLPISAPQTVLSLTRHSETVVEGAEAERAGRHLEALCRALAIRSPHRLVVHEAIPPHAGLGSGTQLALGVAAALRTMHGLPLDPAGDAERLARGLRSGIGIASFAEGGVIVDAGRGPHGGPPPVIARFPFPDDWRVILILDDRSEGLHGEAELAAFKTLPPFPAGAVGEICRLVLMSLMPALVERDLAAFGAAVGGIQQLIGAYFAPAQGGVFTSQKVAALAERLAAFGAVGIGQSSWGPTGFAFAPAADAEAMVGRARIEAPPGTALKIVAGRNAGAEIRATELDLVGS